MRVDHPAYVVVRPVGARAALCAAPSTTLAGTGGRPTLWEACVPESTKPSDVMSEGGVRCPDAIKNLAPFRKYYRRCQRVG